MEPAWYSAPKVILVGHELKIFWSDFDRLEETMHGV